jgi:hypothetical protein
MAVEYGSADGTGSQARFADPSGVAVDGSGNVYVADARNGMILMIGPSGYVDTRYVNTTPWNTPLPMITLAGKAGELGDTDGANSQARFNYPHGVAVDASGNVYVADTGNAAIRVGQYTPVSITTQPVSISVNPGALARFAVAAAGTAPITYQWLKNGIYIRGATSDSFTITSAESADAGNYSVLVSNGAGSVLSNQAALSIVNGGVPVSPSISTQPTNFFFIGNNTPSIRSGLAGADSWNYELLRYLGDGYVAPTGIKGTGGVLTNGSVNNLIPLKVGMDSGLYVVRFTPADSQTPFNLLTTQPFEISFRSWSELSGNYQGMLLSDPASAWNDNAKFRGLLTLTVSPTGSVSGRMLYNEAPPASSTGQQTGIRRYTSVARSLSGVLTASPDEPGTFILIKSLGTLVQGLPRQEISIKVRFDMDTTDPTMPVVKAPIVSATVKDNASANFVAGAALLSELEAVTRQTPKTLAEPLVGRYTLFSDASAPASVLWEDTHLYFTVQILPSGRLMWNSRSPGFSGSGSTTLAFTDGLNAQGTYYEAISQKTSKATLASSLLGRWAVSEGPYGWSVNVGTASADAMLERQASYQLTDPNNVADAWTGTKSIPFSNSDGGWWAGSKTPSSVPAYALASGLAIHARHRQWLGL